MNLKNPAIFLVIFIFGCSSTTPKPLKANSNEQADVYITPTAKYKEPGAISINAKNECNLEKTVVSHFASFSKEYGFTVGTKNDDRTVQNFLEIEITKLTAGRAGSGFGGRWVVSEMEILAKFNGKQSLQVCSAGLGVNPFANFKACDRLERCSKQLGQKLAQWVSHEL